jgi:hypothetical protein
MVTPVLLGVLVLSTQGNTLGQSTESISAGLRDHYADPAQAWAFLMVKRADSPLNPAEKPHISSAISYLGRTHSEPALDVLSTMLDFKYDRFEHLPLAGRYPRSNTYPAIAALASIGDSAVPYVVDGLSKRSESPDYKFAALTALKFLRPQDKNPGFILKLYSQDYSLRSKRLRLLADQAARMVLPKGAPSPPQIPPQIEDHATGTDPAARLQEIFRLSAQLQEGSESAPVEKGNAIRELARWKATEFSSSLAEYLNYAENPTALKNGAVGYSDYPAVAALISLGVPSLPAVAQSLAREGRSPIFRENGLYVIVSVSGSGTEAAKVLHEQADVCQAQSQRLADLARVWTAA